MTIRGIPPARPRGKRSDAQRRDDELAAKAHQEQASRMIERGRAADRERACAHYCNALRAGGGVGPLCAYCDSVERALRLYAAVWFGDESRARKG